MEVIGAEVKTFDGSKFNIKQSDLGWVITNKVTGEKKTVSYMIASKEAQEEFLAGIAYGLFDYK